MSVITFVVGLFLLLMQVPRRPANSSLRLSGSDGTLLATLSPRCSVAGTLRAGTGCSRDRRMHRLRHRLPEQALGPGRDQRRAGLRGRVDRDRAPETIERGRGYVSGNASQAARRSRTPGALGEFDINIEGRHRPAVVGNHRNGEQAHETWGRAGVALPHVCCGQGTHIHKAGPRPRATRPLPRRRKLRR